MTSIEAYKKFELKVNNINTASSIDVGVGEFVLIFNEQQYKWFRNKFRGRSAIYTIDDVQQLIKTDHHLTVSTTGDRYTQFKLPDDYFDYIGSYALASKGTCTGRALYTYQVKLNEIDLHVRDENNKPSFEYHEAPVTISQDNLQVYRTDFTVDSVYLTYYRYPVAIDIEGYTKFDGSASATVDPELYDQAVDEIIDWCALRYNA
jgi:hypothetical protein